MPAAPGRAGEAPWASVASIQRISVRSKLASSSHLLPPVEEVEARISTTRSFLFNAIEADFSVIPSASFVDVSTFLADTYRDRLLFLHRVPKTRKVHLGFAESVGLSDILERPLSFNDITIPTQRAFAPSDDVIVVTLRKVAFLSVEVLLEALHAAFTPIAPLLDAQLHYWGDTGILQPAVTVILDKSKDPALISKLPRRPMICGQPVYAYWLDCPPLCAYCGKEGHAIRDCVSRRHVHGPRGLRQGPVHVAPVSISVKEERRRSRRRSPFKSPSRPASPSTPHPDPVQDTTTSEAPATSEDGMDSDYSSDDSLSSASRSFYSEESAWSDEYSIAEATPPTGDIPSPNSNIPPVTESPELTAFRRRIAAAGYLGLHPVLLMSRPDFPPPFPFPSENAIMEWIIPRFDAAPVDYRSIDTLLLWLSFLDPEGSGNRRRRLGRRFNCRYRLNGFS